VRRPAATIALLALTAALLAACGPSSSGDGTGSAGSTSTQRGGPPGASVQVCATKNAGVLSLQATAVSCAGAQEVLRAWEGEEECVAAQGASHSACTVRGYRCIGAATGVGLAVSCARPGHAIAFVAKRG
jgi:hypothetical protein